ncbi:hypothetical protein VTJ04DRAFT_2973 [Mycothermus thermophilus]|uniref:uncharacterized protein n=1 Tax=Humicola insolens TaxID=85995 RepID=UPI00374265E2
MVWFWFWFGLDNQPGETEPCLVVALLARRWHILSLVHLFFPSQQSHDARLSGVKGFCSPFFPSWCFVVWTPSFEINHQQQFNDDGIRRGLLWTRDTYTTRVRAWTGLRQRKRPKVNRSPQMTRNP